MTKIDFSQSRIFVVAGGPAAGKTTYIQKQLHAGIFPANAFIHDCDSVMESLQEYQDDLQQWGPVAAFTTWEIPARQLAEEALFAAAERKQNIIYDRSCALMSSFEFIETLVRQKSYQLFFYYLEVDIEVAIKRAQAREKATGRHTPTHVIADRINAVRTFLPGYQALATHFEKHDTRSKSPLSSAEKI
jgi:predicted ABC-type ATPase